MAKRNGLELESLWVQITLANLRLAARPELSVIAKWAMDPTSGTGVCAVAFEGSSHAINAARAGRDNRRVGIPVDIIGFKLNQSGFVSTVKSSVSPAAVPRA